ncbi:MAG: diguanylate cyclase (GGDEF)-like protein [Cellvibrionaceae bacterium]
MWGIKLKSISIELDHQSGVDALTLEESNKLVKVQRDILEIVVTGNDSQSALDSLCKIAEDIVDNSIASIMIFNACRTELLVRAAPNLSHQACEDLNGLVPGEFSGSCGTAVYKGVPQFVCDTSTDKRWENLQKHIFDFNVHACWSMPIVDSNNQPIGSFALSSFSKREPNQFQKNLMQTASYLVSLVLRRETESVMLKQAAHYDALTNIPNRSLFNERIAHAMAKANRSGTRLAIFFIDLDNFKQINDKYGHNVGDKVLQEVAFRFQKCIRGEDTFARIGGDEFILLVENNDAVVELTWIAEKLQNAIFDPIVLEGAGDSAKDDYQIAASIGISIYPTHGLTSYELLECADKAMYIAKSSKNSNIQFYSELATDLMKQ